MKTAFETACEAYQVRKQAAHRAHLQRLRHELAQLPYAPLRPGARPASVPAPALA